MILLVRLLHFLLRRNLFAEPEHAEDEVFLFNSVFFDLLEETEGVPELLDFVPVNGLKL